MAAASRTASEKLKDCLRVYLVIGSQDCGYSAERVVQIVGDALAGGVRAVQFRDKNSRLTRAEQLALAGRLQMLCREHGALFFINDDVSLAIQLRSDGVHVGQDDMTLAEVRQLVPVGMIVGVSAGTPEEALAAKQGGADYIGVGAMYHTGSKVDAGEPIGPEGLAEIRAAVGDDCMIVGIGGIQLANAAAVLEAGADGLALISAITGADSPRDAATSLRRLYHHDP
ncbi:thiamine phosphate synthase [Brevibacillus humidisoli]|uniref:thiamine phosphate synthase n=1 Tax=Brevibacillus humidisoli TaxID=2895522 RepID=UPI001E33B027|nr:thiamine phosphate synthase [Brevibacillus humidisoli]UFJ42318.1 thiamine phosphate synthase [Brevibacillus humidisoli]